MSKVTIKNTTMTNSNYGNILLSSYGIFLISSDNNTLSGNTVTANYVGIDFYASSGNVLSGNNVTANSFGIVLEGSSGNILSGNNVTASGDVGINLIDSSDNNTLSANDITANSADGIYLYASSDNTFYHNNFINNTQQVSSDSSPNTWDNGYPSGGNYWSDYRTRYPNASEIDSSGIGNTYYVIDANNTDRYPLMNQYAIPEFPSFLILPLFMMATLLAVVIYQKRKIV
jgi:parallel beta-helix repeat protein